MTFDQVERYRGAGMVLNAWIGRDAPEPVRVLDLGGYFETLNGDPLLPLPALHPNLDTVVADVTSCSLPGYQQLTPNQPLPFDDGQFQITLCMDVLEHIHPDHRETFLNDAFRVTSHAVILAAPFYHPLRDAADRWLAEFLDEVLELRNPMLQEHLANGLPDPAVFEAYLDRNNWKHLRFSNGSLGAWRLVMALKHLLLLSSGKEISLAFEHETLPWAAPLVLEGPGYRDVYVVLKHTSSDSEASAEKMPPFSLQPVKDALDRKHREIRDMHRRQAGDSLETVCSRYLQAVGKTLKEFNRVVDARDTSLREIQMDCLRLERALKLTRLQLERTADHARKLDLVIREKNLVIDELLAREQRNADDIAQHIREYEKGIRELQSSTAYRTGQTILAPLKAGLRLGRKLAGARQEQQPAMEDTEKQTGDETHKTKTDPRVSTLSHSITFSILVPVYNTDAAILEAMIDSVRAQTYPRWQLCLADDASPDDTPRRIIKQYAEKEPERIRYTFLETNGGIAVATRAAAELATGEFVCLLDHDDLLTPDALMENARQLEITPDADYIYSDEDKVSFDGSEYCQPYYKPDFDPELLLCNNYLNHFSVIRRTVFEAAGGYREGFDGSQDYDLYLRITEKAAKIVHIPKILYHWRMIPDSAALDPEAKGGLFKETSIRALTEAVERRGMDASVENGLSPGSYRVRHAVPPGGKVAIIIPTRDAVELLEQCVSTIERHTAWPDYEIVIVDNGSTDPMTLNYLKQKAETSHRFTCLRYNQRFNFSEINNYAVSRTQSEYILFLNNDIEMTRDGWLTAMLEHAHQPAVGAVGAKLLYPNGRIQHAGVIIGMGGIAGHPFKDMPEKNGVYFGHSNMVKNYSAVTGACLLMRRDVFEEIGGFNPELAVSFNDIDLCLEIRRRGYRIVYTPYARMIHHESVSRLDDNDPVRRPRFHSEITYMISKWGETLYEDPYLNPNISILKYDMSLRDPGENATLDAFRKAFGGFLWNIGE